MSVFVMPFRCCIDAEDDAGGCSHCERAYRALDINKGDTQAPYTYRCGIVQNNVLCNLVVVHACTHIPDESLLLEACSIFAANSQDCQHVRQAARREAAAKTKTKIFFGHLHTSQESEVDFVHYCVVSTGKNTHLQYRCSQPRQPTTSVTLATPAAPQPASYASITTHPKAR